MKNVGTCTLCAPLVDPSVGCRLLTEANGMDDLKGTVVDMYWKQGEEPAPAELLYVGKVSALERRRTTLARKATQQLDSEMTAEPSARRDASAAEVQRCFSAVLTAALQKDTSRKH